MEQESRLVRIEEQTKYIKENVDELITLQRQRADEAHISDVKFAKFESRFDSLEHTVQKIETKVAALEPPTQPMGRTSVASWTTGIASVVATVVVTIMEWLK